MAHYGQLFLCASVGVPALVGGSDLLFKINYPGFDWGAYTSKWTPESKNYLDTMTKFFAGSLLIVGARYARRAGLPCDVRHGAAFGGVATPRTCAACRPYLATTWAQCASNRSREGRW